MKPLNLRDGGVVTLSLKAQDIVGVGLQQERGWDNPAS
jgi:hypothetical protein